MRCSKARSARETRREKTGLRLFSLPIGQTLAEFDFAFQPSVERSKIDLLATCGWIRNDETLFIQRPPGVGKSHLAVGLGLKAIEQGFAVQYYPLRRAPPRSQARRGVALGEAAAQEVSLEQHVDHRRAGFEPMGRQEASLFFRLVTYRYGRGSMLITANKSVRDLPELLAGGKVRSTASSTACYTRRTSSASREGATDSETSNTPCRTPLHNPPPTPPTLCRLIPQEYVSLDKR